MSKADLLLKKASSFEKLALYSDRKSFLQTISQDNKWTDMEHNEWYGKSNGIPPAPANSFNQDSSNPLTPPPAMNALAPREQAKPATAPAPAPRSINPEYQKLLGVTPDGKWGPATQTALDAYKAKINKPTLSDGVALGLLLSNSPQ